MRKAELRMNEKDKYDVIKELVDHNGNKYRASEKLGISKRQIDRLIVIYKEKGKYGFVHGNRSKKPVNSINKSISEDIVLLYKTKYQDYNFRHFKVNTTRTFAANYLKWRARRDSNSWPLGS